MAEIIDSVRSGFSAVAGGVMSFPYAKAVYVTVLVFLIVVLAREVYTVLFDRTVYIGKFDYFADGKATPESAKSFSAYIAGQHRLLRAALVQENREREAQRKPTANGFEFRRGLPTALPELATWAPLLADAEIKIQGFDLGKLLTVLRTWVAPPSEITGFVEKSGPGTRVLVTWPQTAKTVERKDLAEAFDTGLLNSDSSAAFAVAASIVWADAAATDATFRKFPRSDFVYWALAWWDYRNLRSRVALAQEFSADDISRWKQARALAEKLAPNAKQYAEIWRLRADIISIAPEKIGTGGVYADAEARAADQKIAEADRKNFDGATTMNFFDTIRLFNKILTTLGPAVGDAFGRFVNATDQSTIYPGRPIWVRKKGDLTASAEVSLLVTAVVTDQNHNRKLLLPDYAIVDATDGTEFEIRLNAAGPAIARATKTNLVYPKGQTQKIGTGVLLVPLDNKLAVQNKFGAPPNEIALSRVEALPTIGAGLTLMTAVSSVQTKLAEVKDNFAIVKPRITAPGIGGAPVLDAEKRLVAMAYSASAEESRFLPLKWLFDQEQLSLP